MDEAGRLITELQQKLAQLDHKVWLYRQDMASEFRKHADSLLSDVPEEVSDTVHKAINELLKRYPSLDLGSQDTDRLRGAVNNETTANWSFDDMSTRSKTVTVPAGLYDGPESPLDGSRNLHEREQEFQGVFTPSYLPLLDSTDRNERRSSASLASPSSSEVKPISIVPQEKSTEERSPTSSSYPPPSLQSHKLQRPRRRNTDDTLIKSDQSDTPVRRSALRRISSSSKPQSPRHVRFEFAGEQFPTTSSPSVELPELDFASGASESLTGLSHSLVAIESPQMEVRPESPPPKKVSSSQALRALSRGPIEDDGTKWTEVVAPSDGSASVPRDAGNGADSDEESLSMRPLSITGRPPRSNGHKKRNSRELNIADNDANDLQLGNMSKTIEEDPMTRNGEKSATEIAEEESILADMAPLQPVTANRPMDTISAEAFEEKNADKSQTSATRGSKKPFLILSDGTDLNNYSGSTAKINVDDDDDDDLFDFDDNTERSRQIPSNAPDSDSDSPTSDNGDEEPSNFAAYATSPARLILKPGTLIGTSNRIASSSSHRSSYHPFQTPIVSEAIHAQAASLGNVASFVGSVKDGLDEMHLQSFRGGGSLRGAAPMSLSERMAFEEAMEAQHEAARKR